MGLGFFIFLYYFGVIFLSFLIFYHYHYNFLKLLHILHFYQYHHYDIDKNVKYVTISKNYNDNDKKLEKKEK
jgi:hypothetical protein